ncbi:MAG: helix-turn-helix domain-containing protein [Myxococcota bacterium]|jgi:excisionase family DNA binding protein|nr:helix-turn-helix domain-containing protein [Myxococcota bacterium]
MQTTATIPDPDLTTLTLDDVGRILHLHPRTVRLLIRSGKLPGCRVGGSYRVLRQDLADFLRRSNLATSPSDLSGAVDDPR